MRRIPMPAARQPAEQEIAGGIQASPCPTNKARANLVVVTPLADGEADLIAVTPVPCFTEPMEYPTVSAGQS
jgi:hypothetical protein